MTVIIQIHILYGRDFIAYGCDSQQEFSGDFFCVEHMTVDKREAAYDCTLRTKFIKV
jgi:hypothetical protein